MQKFLSWSPFLNPKVCLHHESTCTWVRHISGHVHCTSYRLYIMGLVVPIWVTVIPIFPPKGPNGVTQAHSFGGPLLVLAVLVWDRWTPELWRCLSQVDFVLPGPEVGQDSLGSEDLVADQFWAIRWFCCKCRQLTIPESFPSLIHI